MKHNLHLFLCIILSLPLCGQTKYLPLRPYEPLKFTNIAPVWYDTMIDTTGNSEEGNGYNLLNFTLRCKPEIKDNYLYTSYQTSYKGDVSGTYLEKRDISTGNVAWKYSYGHKEVDRPEVARSIIFEKDSVRLLSWKSKDTLGIWPPFSIAGIDVTMTERSFSDMSGRLGTYLTTMPGDTTARKFTANPIFVNKVEYIMKDLQTGGYRCIYHEPFTTPKYILSVPLDRFGRQQGNTDSIITDLLQSFFVYELDNNEILLNHKHDGAMYISIYQDVALQNEKDTWILEDFNTIDFAMLLSIDGEYTIWSHNPNTDNEVISVYHRDKLVSKVTMPEEYHYNTFTFVNDRVIGIASFDNIFNKYDLIEIKNNGLKILKTILTEDDLRFMLPLDLTFHDNLLVYHVEEGSVFINQNGLILQDYPSKANSIIAFSLESLGLSSVTQDQSLNVINIQPNPVQSEAIIYHPDVILSKVELLDISGRIVSIQYGGIGHTTIDVSHIPSGLYFVTATDISGRKQTEKLVVHH